MIQVPCKNCPAKGCGSYHDECEKYQEYQKQRMETLDNSYNARKQNILFRNYVRDRHTKRK